MRTVKSKAATLALILLSSWQSMAGAADDVVITDFESDTYGDWKVTGTAFGDGPAVGTLPGQMDVTGFEGERLVNSFVGGDDSTGTLTSTSFTLDRPYVKFLIGGGGYHGHTCLRLVVDGKTVRESTGPNTVSGGSEMLSPEFWDVVELAGKQATIVVVDDQKGGWGHINVDQIVLSDRKPTTHAMDRKLLVDNDYLLIPIRNGAPKVKIEVVVDSKPIRRYDTELATDADHVDWYAYFTLNQYRGKTVTVSASRANEPAFELIRTSDSIPASEQNYDEPLRPQLHFSQRVGWINDPNGMTYLDGEWHLYFQHNPVGWAWGNMTWGHAVSKDLIHWEQLPNVLFPGTMAKGACFSGGAVIDKNNTAGWKTGTNDVLVAFLTDTGAGESVAYSNDRGRTFTWYESNPIIKHSGRDPKVIWYAYDDSDDAISDEAKKLGGHWAMAVYDETAELGRNTAFYTSTNLKNWTEQSHLGGYFECPEFFELAVEGSAGHTRWVTFGADGRYAVGQFDGKSFTPDHEEKHSLHHGKFYASQTFDNAPDGRRIQIGWMQMDMPGMPFNQAFSFPHELTLKETENGIRMFAAPIKEIETLRQNAYANASSELRPDAPIEIPVSGQLMDVEASFELGDAKVVGLDIGGNRVSYDVADQEWLGASAPALNGRVTVRVLLDRSQMEVWANDGSVVISDARKSHGNVNEIVAFAEGGTGGPVQVRAFELKSIWDK